MTPPAPARPRSPAGSARPARHRSSAALVLIGLVALLSPALAGCVGQPGGPTAGPTDADVRLHVLGTWAKPDSPVVGIAAHDVTGDGTPEVFLAQDDGWVRALDVTKAEDRSEVWRVHVDGYVSGMALVLGERGPALAVASVRYGLYPSGPFEGHVSLLGAATGTGLAARGLHDHAPGAVAAADLDGDGVEDLVLLGRTTSRPDAVTGPSSGSDPYWWNAEVVALDGAFEDDRLSDRLTAPVAGDDAVLWRRALEGRPTRLAVAPVRNGTEGAADGSAPGPLVLAGTDEGLTGLDADGGTAFALREGPVHDVVADPRHVLVAHGHAATLLDHAGDVQWTRSLGAIAVHAALADVGQGPEAFVLTTLPHDGEDGTGGSALVSFAADADGRRRLNVTGPHLNLSAAPSGLAVGPVAGGDRPGIVVAGPHAHDGDDADGGTVVLVAPDGSIGSVTDLAQASPHDRLLLADVHPTGGVEALVGGHGGRLFVVGAVPGGEGAGAA